MWVLIFLLPLIKTPARKFQMNIGDVCFVTEVDNSGEAFTSLDFIRHNVIIMMTAEGSLEKDLRTIAEKLDALLMKNKTEKSYDALSDIPSIKSFSSGKRKINLSEEIPLSIRINNPKARELYFDWNMTGGGVRKEYTGKFFSIRAQKRVNINLK